MFATLLLLIGVSTAAEKNILGGYTPIKDINDPHVQELGEFAVTVHNSRAGTKLNFLKVIYGETQVVNGINYKLVIELLHGALYEAVVYEKRQLSSIDPLKV